MTARPPRDESGLQELEAEARYARDRVRLYRARAYGSRATSASRMRELERLADGAERRLKARRSADASSR